jgi:hypothetical protein
MAGKIDGAFAYRKTELGKIHLKGKISEVTVYSID